LKPQSASLTLLLLLQVAYLADGIPGLIGSPVGGILSDRSAAKHPSVPEARLVHNTLIALITMPSGLLLYAWAMHAKTHMVAIFAGMALNAFGCAAYLPGLFGYLTTLKQSAAAAASAAVQSLMFILAAVVVLVSAVATRAMGYGPWFTLLAGIQLVVTLFAYVIILGKQRAAVHLAEQGLPDPAGSAQQRQQQQQRGVSVCLHCM
jgi:MFS family permease